MKRSIFVSVFVATFVLLSLVGSAVAASGEVLVLHFDEGSGSIARDASGYGNDGTIYGAIWVDGISGKALSFDGRNNYVEISRSNSLNAIKNSFTIETWIYPYYIPAPGRSSWVAVLVFEKADTDNGLWFYNEQLDYYYKETLAIGGHINTNEWQYIVGVWDGSTIRTYINGNQVASGSMKDWGDYNNVLIGIDYDREPYWFNGIIDEVAIYSRALTADEIKTQYLARRAGPTPTPSITLTKSASPSTIQEGETTTVSIRVENTGTGDAKNIEVKDTIPTGFKVISGSKDKKYDSLKANEYRTYQYTLQATGTGRFVLDPATATYSDESGNSYSSASNSVMITSEASTKPITPTEEEKGIPGFEVACAIAGLLGVGYLMRWRKRK